MTDKRTGFTVDEIRAKLAEVELDKVIDLDFYLKAREGGVGSALPIAELLGIDPEIGSPRYVARRDQWAEHEYLVGIPSIAYNHDTIDKVGNLPASIRAIGRMSGMLTYMANSFYKLQFRKDVNGKHYLHYEPYTLTHEDAVMSDWVCTSIDTFRSLYFSKPKAEKPKKKKAKDIKNK